MTCIYLQLLTLEPLYHENKRYNRYIDLNKLKVGVELDPTPNKNTRNIYYYRCNKNKVFRL